jgi:CheY-like chemotaxis protein
MATILIVDDDSGLRESLAETITDLGHHAVLAGTGREALAPPGRAGGRRSPEPLVLMMMAVVPARPFPRLLS